MAHASVTSQVLLVVGGLKDGDFDAVVQSNRRVEQPSGLEFIFLVKGPVPYPFAIPWPRLRQETRHRPAALLLSAPCAVCHVP